MLLNFRKALDLAKGLVKDSEGDVVHIVVNPLDQAMVDEAERNGADTIYLRHLPLGFWVKMEKYERLISRHHLSVSR